MSAKHKEPKFLSVIMATLFGLMTLWLVLIAVHRMGWDRHIEHAYYIHGPSSGMYRVCANSIEASVGEPVEIERVQVNEANQWTFTLAQPPVRRISIYICARNEQGVIQTYPGMLEDSWL